MLTKLVQDAHRFIRSHKRAIELSPLQTYASALVFSPARSLIKDLFKQEEPKWIMIKPAIEDAWGACMSTLEGHSGGVSSVAFSHDSTRLASASWDRTVKVWDASSGACLLTLNISHQIYRISFDVSGSYLQTDIGTVDISALAGRAASSQPILNPCSPQYHGLTLSKDGVWIADNSENLLWLPSEYRPSCSAVSGDTICVGVGTGRVWIFKVECSNS